MYKVKFCIYESCKTAKFQAFTCMSRINQDIQDSNKNLTQVCFQFIVLHGAGTCTWRNTHICVPKKQGIYMFNSVWTV